MSSILRPRPAGAPKVSVCVPVYRGRFLAESIASILGQSYSDFELLVVDDASPDDIAGIVNRFRDARIRFSRNVSNLGLVRNWNYALTLAGGEYLSVFHDDDMMTPTSLERKVAVLDAHPEVGFVHSNARKMNANGQLYGTWASEGHSADFVEAGKTYFYRLITGEDPICCPTVLVRRDCYERLGLFDSRLPQTADWEMWMRIALFYDVAYIHDPLDIYRKHESNATLRFTDNVAELREAKRAKEMVLEKFPDQVEQCEQLRAEIKRYYAQKALRRSRQHAAQRHWRRALSYAFYGVRLEPAFAFDRARWQTLAALASKSFVRHLRAQ